MQMEHNDKASERRMETVRAIAAAHGTSPELVMRKFQTREVRAARQAAILAMREKFNDPVDRIAAFFGRSRRQVQYSLAAASGWGRDGVDRMVVVRSVAEAHGLTAEDVLHGGRRPHVLAARREAIRTAFDRFGDSPASLAAALGIDQTTVRSHLNPKMEA
jgi:predicted transcriptional regulator